FGEESLMSYLKETFGVENLSPEARGPVIMKDYLVKEKVKNPDTNKEADWTDIRQFNLMLSTHLGPVADDASKIYMRPETCQSLFTDFKQVCDTTRIRIPFGLAQIGKAFRNEITPGQFLYRTREFEQMEIEYFVPADPEEAEKHFSYWKEISMHYWKEILGIPAEKLQYKKHDKLAHYAADAYDIEYQFPWGRGEVQGIHNRTDFDLRQHQEFSKKDMQYHDPKTGLRYIPRCIEASTGLGRSLMVSLLEFYDEEELTNKNGEKETRVVVRFPFALAPVKYAILPLMEKDEAMVAKGREIFSALKKIHNCEFDLGGAIGKRYRRQDEIGTPYCITIDHQSLEDGTVTIRDRDTMEQKRVNRNEII
ncbi:MAG TPA: glycine--tRNA ligase, partial [Candidatus Absconditabacterales bacterium]|nr:glycine--tRNA ligase [Candidatus Absconditabacterales bacterium]